MSGRKPFRLLLLFAVSASLALWAAGSASALKGNHRPRAAAASPTCDPALTGTAGPETINGTAGDDHICGLGGNDTLNGLGGDDIIEGGTGIDTINGGANADQLFGDDGNDRLNGGSGNDTIDGGAGQDGLSFPGATEPATVDLSAAAPQVTNDGFGDSDTVASVENLNGTPFADHLTGNGVKNVIQGAKGPDTLIGLGGTDYLYGNQQEDALLGGGGNDTLTGGNETDSCDGGAGTNTTSTCEDPDAANNDAPVNSLPGPQSTDQDTALVLSSGDGNLVSISDIDAGAGDIEVTLTGTNGTVTLASTTGLTFSAGDGTGDATMTFAGSPDMLNAALDGMTFDPTPGFFGAASLDVDTDDLGHNGAGGSQTDSDSLSIDVIATNDAPTDISLSNSTVDENQASGTTVGTLSATDPDVGDTHTFTLENSGCSGSFPDNTSFQISTNSLQTNATFNFEADSSYTICVRATDSGTPAKSFDEQFTISVNDVNEAPTDISLDNNDIDENQPSATTIGSLTATDPDLAQTHSFSLQNSGCSGSFPDNSSFSISGNSLKSAVSFNFEVKNSYTVCVRTTDSGSPALSFDKQFTITINDVNDAPVGVADGPYNGVIGNTKAQLGTTSSGPVVTLTGSLTIANDTDEDATFPHTLTAVAETVSSTGGGSATIGTDGSFTYVPGVGDKNQNDTFTYHVTDGALTSAGTVTVSITNNLVWYADRDLGVNGDGRSTSPFNNLAGINGAGGSGDADGTGDVIFLYGSATSYTGGLPLEASQQLIGEPNGLVVNTVNLVPAAGANPTVTNGSGTGVALGEGTSMTAVTVSNSSGSGVSGTNINAATIASSVTISGNGGSELDLSGGNGSISVSAPITNGAAGRAVQIQNRTGGTTALSGLITDNSGTGTGISLTNNGATTINLTGGVVLSTGTNAAFTATGGGTVNVTGATNTITTTTGQALNVANTNIGSSGLTFQSITAGTGADSTGNGITLDTTGTSGGLTVTGDNTGTANGSGGTIQHKSGSNGSTAQGIGIYLNNTKNVSLDQMNLHDFGNFAIYGGQVNGFTLQDSNITGTNGDDLSAILDEGAVIFDTSSTNGSLIGTATIDDTTISGGEGDNLRVTNNGGTMNLTVTDSSLGNPQFSTSQDDMLIVGNNNASNTVTVKNTDFINNQSGVLAGSGSPRGIQVTSNQTATSTITIGGPNVADGNTFQSSFVQIDLGQNSSNAFNYLVQNNTLQYVAGYSSSMGINIFQGANVTGLFSGSILNNGITHDATLAASSAIVVSPTGDGSVVTKIANNTVTWSSGGLINVSAGNVGASSAAVNATITGNTLNLTTPSAGQHGILVNAGTGSGDTNNVCADIKTNNVTRATGSAGSTIRVRNRFVGISFRLPGYVGSATDMTAVQNFLAGQNTLSPTQGADPNTVTATNDPAGSGFAGGAACTQPS